MELDRNLLKGSGGFAVEAYPPESNMIRDDRNCKKTSSEQLQPLIKRCDGRIILRTLTAEERGRIGQFKVEQKGKTLLSFEL